MMLDNKNKLIRYSSSFDQSGYGVSARDTCSAMMEIGLNMITNIIYTPMSRREFSRCQDNDKITLLNMPDKKASVNICEQVPILWNYGFQKNSYCVGRMFWETDRLPAAWVEIINSGYCNEIWASCQWNKDVYINSGVKKPVYVIPPVVGPKPQTDAQKKLDIPNSDAYKFYSIFQWTNRKNPEALLRAYFNEFTAKDNVLLVIKSYGPSGSLGEQRSIKEFILHLKESSGNPNPPSVFYIGELITQEQINSLHEQCECYISTSRAEGWNVPLTDAMKFGNQVITTKIGGISDLLDDTTAYVIPHVWGPVTGMPFGDIYNETMRWGYVEISDVQHVMRRAYNERNNFSERSKKYNNILEQCNKNAVLKLINERLEKIS